MSEQAGCTNLLGFCPNLFPLSPLLGQNPKSSYSVLGQLFIGDVYGSDDCTSVKSMVNMCGEVVAARDSDVGTRVCAWPKSFGILSQHPFWDFVPTYEIPKSVDKKTFDFGVLCGC
jgi:hypothetical protein